MNSERDMSDKTAQAADEDIEARVRRLERAITDPLTHEAVDELTRIRHELTALRKLVERVIGTTE
jgi:hypothetical protein